MTLVAPWRAPILAIVAGLLLVGCGKHSWSKPDSGPGDFTRESNECARENSVMVSSTRDYGVVIAGMYKDCLKSRGWVRGQQWEPPPAASQPMRAPETTPPVPPQPPPTR